MPPGQKLCDNEAPVAFLPAEVPLPNFPALSAPQHAGLPPRGKGRWVIRLGWAALVLALALGAAGIFAYQSAQVVPDFYAQAVRESPPAGAADAPPQRAAPADQLEHELLELRREVKTNELWELRITAGEINAWLARELPRKFPSALPRAISEPRVALAEARLMVGFRYADRLAQGVLTLELEPFLAPAPHTVGVRIRRARWGDLPLPLGNRLVEIQTRAQRAGIPVQIAYSEGDPILLAWLPLDEWTGRAETRAELTALSITGDQLILQGRNRSPAPASGGEMGGGERTVVE